MYIEFSIRNWKLLLFLVYPVFFIIQDYFSLLYLEKDKDNSLFRTFRCYLSFILSGILLLIYRINTKKKEEGRKESNLTEETEEISENDLNQIELERQTIASKNITKKIIFLLSLSIIGIVSIFLGDYFFRDDYSYEKSSVRTFFQITNFVFWSFFILKQKFYKHHFISYGCITILLIPIFIIFFPYMKKIPFACIYYGCSEFVFALYDVLIKKYMNLFYKNPYHIMPFSGVISIFLLLIYDISAYFINPSVSGIIIGFRENITSIGEWFLFIIDLILEFIWNLGIWLLIFYFTPCHYFIADYISEFIYFIVKYFKEPDSFYSNRIKFFLMICFSIIIFIFFLIFNEVIILNFCGLDYNTRKRLIQREKKENKSFQNISISLRSSNIIDEEVDE